MRTLKEKQTPPRGEHLSYEGTVKVTLQKKGGGIKVKKFKNNGGYPLFNFLALSACGSYKKAESFRPKYIGLFHIDPAPGEEEISITTIKEALAERDVEPKSTRVLYKSTPISVKGSDDENPQ